MKTFAFSFLTIILAASLAFTNGDAKADAILKKSRVTFENLADFSANFKYIISNPARPKAAIQKSGELTFKKGMFAIKMEGEHIYCNKEKIWDYLVEDNEVNIMEYDPEDGFNIQSIFTLYQTKAKTRYDGVETILGISCHKIYMSAIGDEMEFNQVSLWINKSNNVLVKAITTNRNQTRTTYEFTQTKTNQGLSDKDFVFDVATHTGVEVYDETE